MIKIERTKVLGWEAAIRGMRNPMNSWDKSDSGWYYDDVFNKPQYALGKSDISLMERLSQAGPDHAKFKRMIVVYCDITAPLYWWKEFDTYKVGTVANSCSTMHKIADKEFVKDDFSHEHLYTANDSIWIDNPDDSYYSFDPIDILEITIDMLNKARERYLETKSKEDWWQMIQLLPSSYNQKRTVMLNYQVLTNIYHSRKDHKLDEWHDFCDWIETLPESQLIIEKKETE